jgi:hypothetical protein
MPELCDESVARTVPSLGRTGRFDPSCDASSNPTVTQALTRPRPGLGTEPEWRAAPLAMQWQPCRGRVRGVVLDVRYDTMHPRSGVRFVVGSRRNPRTEPGPAGAGSALGIWLGSLALIMMTQG